LPPGCNLAAFFDTCHSGTLLDLPHHHCNGVWMPWVSKNKCRTDTLRYRNARGRAALMTPAKVPSVILPERRNASAPVTRSHEPHNALKYVLTVNTRDSPGSFPIPSRNKGTKQPMIMPNLTLTSSPQRLFCDGWCPSEVSQEVLQANVISISSCSDLQRTWEGDNYSMTRAVCKYLQTRPYPSYEELMKAINFESYENDRALHSWTRSERKKMGKGRRSHSKPSDLPEAGVNLAERVQSPVESVGEMNSYQSPALSSLVKLNMAAKFGL